MAAAAVKLPATYDEFLEEAFAYDQDSIRDLQFIGDFARLEDAYDVCETCGLDVLNVEVFVDATDAQYEITQEQADDLHARLMDNGALNATRDGICGVCHREIAQD